VERFISGLLVFLWLHVYLLALLPYITSGRFFFAYISDTFVLVYLLLK